MLKGKRILFLRWSVKGAKISNCDLSSSLFKSVKGGSAQKILGSPDRGSLVVEPDLDTSLRRLDTVQPRRQRLTRENRAMVHVVDDRPDDLVSGKVPFYQDMVPLPGEMPVRAARRGQCAECEGSKCAAANGAVEAGPRALALVS